MTSRIPELENTSYLAIREWFRAVTDHMGGEGWHADDDPSDIVNSRTGVLFFTDEEADSVKRAMKRIRPASQDWHDPDMLYDLAYGGPFKVERAYPGFHLDVSTIAGRLNHTTIPGREHPNLLVEEMGQYALLEFPDRNGPVSEQEHFILRAIEKSSADGWPLDPAAIVVLEDQVASFTYIGDLEERLVEFAEELRTPVPSR